MQEAPSKGRASKLSRSVPAFTQFAQRVNRDPARRLALYNGGGAKYERLDVRLVALLALADG
ncbi:MULTISPECIES: hypothetical protein [unclassified Mesorhizobium]|uniref:hypothetical protein n=1 Tax=unclassified Mesorhizobium TaxID=325217 RepID=UPI0013E3EA00|nr:MULTISPECIES: hypothetical protein [unclassified Mesorhizobium]